MSFLDVFMAFREPITAIDNKVPTSSLVMVGSYIFCTLLLHKQTAACLSTAQNFLNL